MKYFEAASGRKEYGLADALLKALGIPGGRISGYLHRCSLVNIRAKIPNR